MYLHLGQSVTVSHREVLAIFDLDNATWAYRTREFLQRAEREGRAVWLTSDLPRSLVLTGRSGGESTVYLSPLSSAALRGRAARNFVE